MGEQEQLAISTKLAGLEERMSSMEKTMNKMDEKLDMWNQNFIPRAETMVMLQLRDDRLIKQDEKIQGIEDGLQWIRRTLIGAGITATIGGIIALIIAAFNGKP